MFCTQQVTGSIPVGGSGRGVQVRLLGDKTPSAPARETFGWFATATSVPTRHSPAMREMSVTEQRYTSALAPSMGFEPRDVLEMPHFLIGTIQQIEADLKLRRERYGFS